MKKLRNYFEDNLVAYSYLFFAQTMVAASDISLKFTAKNPPSFAINSTLAIPWIFELPFLLYILPLIFIIGFLVKFRYPKDKFGKGLLFLLNLFLVFVIIISAIYSKLI